jgi:hypothetical protein
VKTSPTSIDFQGIQLSVGWQADGGVSVSELPKVPGIYAEIHWPKMGVRVGETGGSIRTKIRHDIHWFNSMWDGSAPPEQLRRTIPIAMTAKESGATAFELYVVSIDPRLSDKALRQECERFMFRWLEEHPNFVSWNHQRSWR